MGGWDCSFPRDVASLEPSANTESPCERAGTWGGDLGGVPGIAVAHRSLPQVRYWLNSSTFLGISIFRGG